jgi:hypothetical protein
VDFYMQQTPQTPPAYPQDEHRIDLEAGKRIIIDVLSCFDADLGQKACEILFEHADHRMNIAMKEPGNLGMMQSRPAHSKIDFMRNDASYAIIDFDYDQTLGSVILLAHELGHAMADDGLNDQGFTYEDLPEHMAEVQAYFVQSIIYDALENSTDQEFATAARKHREWTEQTLHAKAQEAIAQGSADSPALHYRPLGFLVGKSLAQEALRHEAGGEARAQIANLVLNRDTPPLHACEIADSMNISAQDLFDKASEAKASPSNTIKQAHKLG